MSIRTSIPIGGGTGLTLPVRYVDAELAWRPPDLSLVHSLAGQASLLACKAFDVARGHFDPRLLSGSLTPTCLERLTLFARILEGSDFGRVRKADFGWSFPPIVPMEAELFAVWPGRFEAVVSLSHVKEHFRANVSLEARGGGWICTLLDLG
ncbi:hypothetical protein BACT_0670 [Bifidobacterium actinocoloniiforme DSM 22766]|uniref:Uncharacterized protein n=2 Tax=Bifidobacterium actinocoloniiforme TaxID=638619 RepID=A0A086Z0B9_9BIFI|nr:hypothetical protein AB656_01970 [Bifidobacterium actinocoloniiforme DSM 22766]KFI39969.1 hypothetical protein BACT_0670 [Bifidobacterium actinocoloniiforme DSM 22766]